MNTDETNEQNVIELQNNEENTTEPSENLKKKRTVTSTVYPLPHPASTLEQHIKIIKAYFIATEEGKKPKMYKDFENLVDFHYTYVSANNKFFENLGLIESSGSHGMYIPTKYAIEFQQYKNWGQEEKALIVLKDLVKKSWFWQSAKQVLLMREEGAANEKEILNKLGADSKANPEKHMGSLKVLLNYLEYTGLVKRDEKTNRVKMTLEIIPQELLIKEPITEKTSAIPSQINEPEKSSKSTVVQPTSSEPIHYREEPGHFTLQVKLDETSIQLLEEEIKYIKGKHALLQKSKKADDEAK